MNKTVKISLVALFLAITAIVFVYLKFNLFNDEMNKQNKDIKPTKIINIEESYTDLYNQNKLDLVIEDAKQDLNKNQDDYNALILLANAYLQKGSLEFKEDEYGQKGLELADKILKLNPKSETGWFLKGYAYEIMQKYPEALQAYNKALELSKEIDKKENPDILNQIGHVYDLMGDKKKSEEYYQRAAKLNPKDTNIVMNLARVDYEEGNYEKALKGFKYVVENDKNARRKAEAAYMIEQCYLTEQLFNLKEAEKYAELSVKYDDKFPMAWVGKAQSALVKGMKDESTDFSKQMTLTMNYFDKAIALNPNQTEAHLKKAQVLYFMEMEKESKEEYQKALDSVDKDITLMNDAKKEMKKLISEEMAQRFKSKKVSKYIESAIIAITMPEVAEAGCSLSGTTYVCTSRADAIARMNYENSINDKKYPDGRHHFYWKNGYAVCGNGWQVIYSECGNEKKEKGEECDDGNTQSGDGCSSSCTIENSVCGNGILESWGGEQCDDGNTINGDECSSTCLRETIDNKCYDNNGNEVDCGEENSNSDSDDDLSNKTDDDLSDGTDDDLTKPGGGSCNDGSGTYRPIYQPSYSSQSLSSFSNDAQWSVDKIHWIDSFNKLIPLKHNKIKIYTKGSFDIDCSYKVWHPRDCWNKVPHTRCTTSTTTDANGKSHTSTSCTTYYKCEVTAKNVCGYYTSGSESIQNTLKISKTSDNDTAEWIKMKDVKKDGKSFGYYFEVTDKYEQGKLSKQKVSFKACDESQSPSSSGYKVYTNPQNNYLDYFIKLIKMLETEI